MSIISSNTTRRNFLRSTAGFLGLTAVGISCAPAKKKPLLSFSTLGCPDWSFQEIVQFAADHSYNGIEIRGIKKELDLPQCPEFNSAQSIRASMNLMEEKGVKLVNLGASASLHSKEPAERLKNIDEGKRFIDLAAALKCPYVRIFPNDFPENQERNETIELIVNGLGELGQHAKGTGVRVLMESHGKVVYIKDLKTIMDAAKSDTVGLVWDIANMWSATKESPADAYAALKEYIYHTHIKDLTVEGDKLSYSLLGRGNTPIFEAIDLLAKGGYAGYYSWEWEKRWHPEIEEPEIALADYVVVMNKHFA
ncbi:MAG: sugar phosphate isomerase/epimerase [Chitinophagaceae bacterium]|nr:sugar phosphate isomerase/epimerase [Chitinophagaceae bacterium]